MKKLNYQQIVARNKGIIKNQNCLKDATVAIAGCGGAGGEVPVTLARMGVGNILLADPDVFDISNLNRQFGSNKKTLGCNKARVIQGAITEINSYCSVVVYEEGITEENIEEFLTDVDVAIEEIDVKSPYYSVLFHRTARRLGIPVLTGVEIGWGSFLFCFAPNAMTFEEYIGLPKNATDDEIKAYSIPATTYCPEIPDYVDPELLQKVISGEVEIPAIAPAANLTAGMLASFTYFLLSGEREVLSVPHYYSCADMMTVASKQNTLLTLTTAF